MTAVRQYKENWRHRLNMNSESTWKHIARAADRLQPLLPEKNAAGGGWNFWRVFDSPKLVEWRAGEKFEIETRVPAENLPTLNRFGF